MKKKISISQLLLWLLVIGLLISLVFNVVQYYNAASSKHSLQGSYTTDAGSGNGIHFAFDAKGHYCRYSQTQGLLEEGNYTQSGESLYQLDSTTGQHSSVLLTENGVYYSVDGDLIYFTRFNDTPTFIGNWAENWSHWPEGPYKLQEGKAN